MHSLLVAMTHGYGDPRRPISYDVINFGGALSTFGRCEHFDYVAAMQMHGVKAMNLMLEALTTVNVPEVVFHPTWHEELNAYLSITYHKACNIGFGWDDDWRGDYAKQQSVLYDYWVTTSDTFDAPNVIRSQYAVHPPAYPRSYEERDIDISFIGQPHGERVAFIEAMQKAGLDVAVFGYGWRGYDLELTHEQMVEVLNRSKIVLNLSKSSSGGVEQVKGRVFEVPACGALLLTDPAPALGDYYDDTEVVTYDSVEDCIEKAKHYLAHEDERDDMAEAAYSRTIREHTWVKRFEDIFKGAGLCE